MKIIPILLAILLLLIGCAPFVKVIPIDEGTAKKLRADVKYYDIRDLDSISYETIQPIEATSCKHNIWDPAASQDNAIDQLRYLAKSYGGNAIAEVDCSGSEGTSLLKNCWNSVVCRGVAIRVLEPSAIPTNSENTIRSESKQKPGILPARVLIPGVPFISWREALQLKHAGKNIVNPSVTATSGMVLEFWGKDRKLLERADFKFESSGLKITSGENWTITDLKASLARGVPVNIILPLTPVAHPLSWTSQVGITMGQVKGVKLKDGPRSNALGQMMSLHDLKKVKEQMKMNPIYEDYTAAERLVIGYDDQKKVYILHDPSFGPAFEINYGDFDKMWEVADRNYTVVFSEDLPHGMPKENAAAIYRERSPNEHAAEHFVYGYALDCLVRLPEGAEQFEKGLSIPGISKGYAFMLYFELALNLAERGDFAHAVEAAEKAKALVPEAPAPWDFLSKAYLIYPAGGGDREKASEYAKKAKELVQDQWALKAAAASLPADFMDPYAGTGINP